MIKTPVELGHRINCIIDADGNVIACDVDYKGGGQEIVKRINLHEKLIILLKESKFALSQQYGVDSVFLDEVNNVLEKCK